VKSPLPACSVRCLMRALHVVTKWRSCVAVMRPCSVCSRPHCDHAVPPHRRAGRFLDASIVATKSYYLTALCVVGLKRCEALAARGLTIAVGPAHQTRASSAGHLRILCAIYTNHVGAVHYFQSPTVIQGAPVSGGRKEGTPPTSGPLPNLGARFTRTTATFSCISNY